MTNIKKIGLFGGTFDPIHHGHLIVAESVLNELKLQKIYFIPAHKHALKENENITNSRTRYKLLQLALNNYQNFDISDIELKSAKISYTIDTISRFKEYEKLTDCELFNIIGYDNLTELHLWKDYEKILEQIQFVVLKRTSDSSSEVYQKYKNKVTFLESPQIDISSTEIRQRIKENKSWQSLVPEPVYDYITKNNLYS